MRRSNEFISGISFVGDTEHQPVVTLFSKMELDMLPPRVERFHLKLMHYQFTMQYVPGKIVATADVLSKYHLSLLVFWTRWNSLNNKLLTAHPQPCRSVPSASRKSKPRVYNPHLFGTAWTASEEVVIALKKLCYRS